MRMRATYYRIVKKFDFDDSLTVDFRDIFEGPAAIKEVPMAMFRGFSTRTFERKGEIGTKGSFDRATDKRRSLDDDEQEELALFRRQRSANYMETV
eukprot:CAMPEP_0172324868 /NCGR_PEP_ID=MMETSP1058-20130122/52518_1 /TAXON_ID=83371 /ORGANISM="Detonula confervacea, Strain CCMP 353" /LENGTH=95 /DNA_ID=CAMNT_0013041275 /DNA_START=88 /DNA_END=375 /DNA_ORIENTATION=+